MLLLLLFSLYKVEGCSVVKQGYSQADIYLRWYF